MVYDEVWIFLLCSMETGGALWFENLCMADPFYLLPILTSSTLYLQVAKLCIHVPVEITNIQGEPYLLASPAAHLERTKNMNEFFFLFSVLSFCTMLFLSVAFRDDFSSIAEPICSKTTNLYVGRYGSCITFIFSCCKYIDSDVSVFKFRLSPVKYFSSALRLGKLLLFLQGLWFVWDPNPATAFHVITVNYPDPDYQIISDPDPVKDPHRTWPNFVYNNFFSLQNISI